MSFCVVISAHGLGHINQMRPLLKMLRNEHHSVILITDVDVTYLKKVNLKVESILNFSDLGLISEHPVMKDSILIDKDKTEAKLLKIVENMPRTEVLVSEFFKSNRIACVISNVDVLPLWVAQKLSIKNYALCSLDWFSVYDSLFSSNKDDDVRYLLNLFKATYQQCNVFFRPNPSVKVDWLTNEIPVNPMFIEGESIRFSIDRFFNLKNKKLVLVNFGGIEYEIDQLPSVDGVVWIIRNQAFVGQANVLNLSELEEFFAFEDIFSSVDLVVTKPGYGTFVLAASHGVPLLSIQRNGWIDVASLEAWVQHYSPFFKICEDDLSMALRHIDCYLMHPIKNKMDLKPNAEMIIQQIIK